MTRRSLTAGVIALALGLASAGPAQAGRVGVVSGTFYGCGSDRTLVFTGGGETNKLTLAQVDGRVNTGVGFPGPSCTSASLGGVVALVNDPGAPLGLGSSCYSSAYTRTLAYCAVGGVDDFVTPASISLGDGGDYLDLVLGTPATITAGRGNDQLRTLNGKTDTVDCGTGRDTVTADAADRLTGCEAVTRV